MNWPTLYRILNGMIWFWLWLSAALDFVPDPQHFDRFRALFQLSNSFDEAYAGQIVGRAFFFLLLWFLVDRFLRKLGRPKAKE